MLIKKLQEALVLAQDDRIDFSGHSDSTATRLKTLEEIVVRLQNDSIAFSSQRDSTATRIKTLEAKLEKALLRNDTLLMRKAESRLLRRYDETRIKHTLDEIDKELSDPSQLDRFSSLMHLLKHYKQYNEEIRAVLKEIQKDPELRKSVRQKAFIPNAIKKIETTEYHKKHSKEEWTIDYLNGLIGEALVRLREAGKEYKETSLTDLIDRL